MPVPHGVTLIEMMIVVAIVGLIAGISFPAVTSGLDNLRLTSASDSLVSFLNGAMNRAERRQQVVEIAISIKDNAAYLTTAGLSRKLDMTSGVTIRTVWPKPPTETGDPRRFLLLPGGTVPRIGIEIANLKGARRIVRVNPMTGVPEIERLESSKESAE
jgi:prepilin-type N-terminal cleavage/methylation domain-containing protein